MWCPKQKQDMLAFDNKKVKVQNQVMSLRILLLNLTYYENVGFRRSTNKVEIFGSVFITTSLTSFSQRHLWTNPNAKK